MGKNKYKANFLSKYSTHNIILKYIGENKDVLDVGCYTGYIGKNADKSNRFYGIDYDKNAIREAGKTYTGVLSSDLNTLKLLPWKKKYDLIIFADVLEHLVDPEKVLNFYIKNYLKKGGRAIISLPNIANWQIRLNLLFGKFNHTETGIMDKTHLHFYTYKTAMNLIKKSELKIIKEKGGSSILGPIISKVPFSKSLLATGIILINEK